MTSPSARRPAGSLRGTLVRLGFADPERAERLLADERLRAAVGPLDDGATLGALGTCASPDEALLGLTRLVEAAHGTPTEAALRTVLAARSVARDRLLGVLGASTALADHLARHPQDAVAIGDGDLLTPDPDGVRAELLAAVEAVDVQV